MLSALAAYIPSLPPPPGVPVLKTQGSTMWRGGRNRKQNNSSNDETPWWPSIVSPNRRAKWMLSTYEPVEELL